MLKLWAVTKLDILVENPVTEIICYLFEGDTSVRTYFLQKLVA
jgi:hypothetical protein